MASIETELRALVLGFPAVSALLGSLPNSGRLYHLVLPQNPTFPAATFACMNGHPQKKALGIGHPVYRFSCYSDVSFAAAAQVRQAIEDGLDRYSGDIGAHVVTQAAYESRDEPGDPGTGRHRADVTFRINYVKR